MAHPPASPPRSPGVSDLADRLHSLCIRLLRQVRAVDAASGLTGPRLSALSVLVFRGPMSVSDLAAVEQVRVPTMTRLVQGLERDGLVRRAADRHDRRVSRVAATARGSRLLREGRDRRVQAVADLIASLPINRLESLEEALDGLEPVFQIRSRPGG